MSFLQEITPSIRKTIEGHYYFPKECERKSLVEEIEKRRDDDLVAVIAEIKPASPTEKELIEPGMIRDYGNSAIKHGAAGLSILTEPTVFKGDLKYLDMGWKVPTLMKDFVIDRKQLGQGDCVLIIQQLCNMLEIDVNELVDIAHEYDQEVLLEVCNEKEMKQAKDTEADIIGINNRNLATLKGSVQNTVNILKNKPTSRMVISESFFETADDVRRVIAAGASGVLVGTSLIKAYNKSPKDFAELMKGFTGALQ